jgi:hypothetical protein
LFINYYFLNPACPVKFFAEKERSEFNRGTSEPSGLYNIDQAEKAQFKEV